ncbi:hypothetical protein C7I85_15190 [Mesorhizobium soli]|uniref:Uncharacterized protein n=2 Tax=Pseudaminobacter soli (ex Li et al. 2025) TaxID=1295366 RepID=A0A2P7SB28_9HYPH|nr:hypothetical protein C7I85_15190 [Mesorhizobium soli]
MPMNHRILFGSYPIPRFANVANHNFLVWTDEEGRPLFEINGGASNPDGTFNYAAAFSRLTAVQTDYARRDPRLYPEFYVRPTSRTVTLFEAGYREVAARWRAGVEMAERIAAAGLRYSFLTQNSNSVASTVARSMELSVPSAALGILRAPGGRRRLRPVDIHGSRHARSMNAHMS